MSSYQPRINTMDQPLVMPDAFKRSFLFGILIVNYAHLIHSGQILPDSPGERCGELKVGDRIIAVNGVDIAGMTHGDVVNLIKESGLYVRLTIGDPTEDGHIIETNGGPHQMQSQLCL